MPSRPSLRLAGLLALLLFLSSLLLLSSPPAARAQAPATWQQRVAYEMDVTLLADTHQMRGTQRLAYTNNSPDTLRTVYYHLYFNAFNPNSMMAERNRHLPDPDGRIVPRIFNLGPDEVGYHRILELQQDGQDVDFKVTDTVVRVDLAEPILPGATTVFTMRFRSQVPLQTRRSGRDNREGIDYSMSQWYPKMAEYDERGWHADPYVGREFYAPYGTFDVRITLPATYTVGSTGTVQNPGEVGHGYAASGMQTWRPEDGSFAPTDSLTWHLRAENVHDFAWSADPDYIHEQIDFGTGTLYHLLYETDVEERWNLMRQWVPDLMRFFSAQYGEYPYPQFTAAQAGDGGMEYPMIVFLTGERSPGSLLGVTAHEAAHEWFYGVLGSNEADYSWMDEGFTSYATTEGVAYVRSRRPSHIGSRIGYLYAQEIGVAERISTPADWFQTNIAFGIASYTTGEMIVDMLGYVIGPDERDRWLKAYFRRKKFSHPDPFDLEKIAEDVSGLRLDWYFEQFTNTTRRLDYAIAKMEQEEAPGDSTRVTLRLERKDAMVMPMDVRLTLDDGTEQWITVPLGIMQGHKPVPADWIVAEPWLWTFPDYTLTVTVPSPVAKAELDPAGQTPDYNRLNNASRFPVSARFLQPPEEGWFEYGIGWRPLAVYAHDFGPGVGVQARGGYLFGNPETRAMLTLYPQVIATGGDDPDTLPFDGPFSPDGPDFVPADADGGPNTSFFDGIDYELRSESDVRPLGAEARLGVSFRKQLGFMENAVTLTRPLAPFGADVERTLTIRLAHQLNPSDRVFGADVDVADVILRNGEAGTVEAALNPFQQANVLAAQVGLEVADGADRLALTLEAGSALGGVQPLSSLSLLSPDPFADIALPDPFAGGSATRLHLAATKTARLGRVVSARADMQLGLGARGLLLYKNFQLGSLSLEEQWRTDAFRQGSAAFANPTADARLMAFAPAGPVAYRNAAFALDGQAGRNLLAGRLSLAATPFRGSSRSLRSLRLEAFSGIGQAWSSGVFLAGFAADDLLADAGLGAAFDLSDVPALGRWTAQSDVLQGLTLVARFPFWVSDPEVLFEDDEVAFRTRVGVQVGL